MRHASHGHVAMAAGAMALVAGLALAVHVRAQDRSSSEHYSLEVHGLVVDNCDVICPCLFGNQPSHGHCRNVATIRIDKGELAGTKLDGVTWAMLGEFTGETRKGATWGYHAFYLDERATPAQRSAMKRILGAPPFSMLGELLGITETRVDYEVAAGLLPSKVKIGDKGEFTAEPIPGGDPRKPQAIENPIYPFPADRVIFARASGKFEDHGKTLDLEASSGELSTFTLQGDVPVAPPPLGMKHEGE